MVVRVDLIFDTICPWCYIGKRRFERALAQRPDIRIDIRWRPFLLNPEMPPGGMDRRSYLERKFGSPHRVQRVFGAVASAGQHEGIAFQFDRIPRTPSSIASHRFIAYAGQQGCQAEAVEAVFHAYFLEGRDIGETSTLATIGTRLGLPELGLLRYLERIDDVFTVQAENARAHRLGVNGVPCFIFDGGYAIAGAQEPDILVHLLDLAEEGQLELALGQA